MKELKFYNKDREGNRKICGSMTIKNQTDSSADLFFYGDIVSETWQSECYEEDMAPGDVKEFLDQLDGTENINIHIILITFIRHIFNNIVKISIKNLTYSF